MLRVAGFEKESIVDGEGLRYVIFTQGCNHNCLGCQNPESHDFNGGRLVDTQTIIKEILENPLLDGVTLSGGDPFFQAKELITFINIVKEHGLTVWAYTGFKFNEFLKFITGENCDKRINQDMIDMLRLLDVIVDEPFVLSKKSLGLKFRGSTNQHIIAVQKSLNNKYLIEYKCV